MRRLHDIDAVNGIVPVVVAFAGIRDGAAIGGNITPTPLIGAVFVKFVMSSHFRCFPMQKFKTYLVSYRHDGAQWNIELPATSLEDAQQRLGQLHFGRVDGEVIANLPSSMGPIAELIARLRNLIWSASR